MVIAAGETGGTVFQSPDMGNKINNLDLLARAGVRVPRGFGLPYRIYEDHVEPLLPEILAIGRSEHDYQRMAERIQAVITRSPLESANEVLAKLEELIPGASYFAVRSSGSPIVKGQQLAEDSAEASLAGQYESFLFVPARNVPRAILWCFASLFSERCLRQFKALDDSDYLQSRMSVLVQEMCLADLSAVVMTRDPVEGGDHFGMEVTYGACEALVSGEVQGDLYILSRSTGKILSAELGTKTTRIQYNPLVDLEVTNRVNVALSNHERSCYAASQEQIAQIYDLSMLIERQFGVPQDIELVLSGNEIIVTQTRPITASN